METQQERGSDLKVAFVGLALGIVWILIVSAFAYSLAAH